MRRICKLVSAISLSVALVLGAVSTALADSGVEFRSFEEKFVVLHASDDYTSTDLFDNFKNVMPGDILVQKVNVTNEYLGTLKVSMSAEAHDEEGNPLTYSEDQAKVDGKHDETVATVQDFLSQLHMIVRNDDEVIFEGSPDQEGQLAEPVELGVLASGKSLTLTVELNVPLSLGNEYANRVGEVDWVFRADEVVYPGDPDVPDPEDPIIPEDPDYPDKPLPDTGDEDPKPGGPLGQTGDATPLMLLTGVAVLAAALVVIAALMRRFGRH